MQKAIELSIAAKHISRKSDTTIISEIMFIGKCIKIKEKDDFLSVLFLNLIDPKDLNDDEIDEMKESLLQVQNMLAKEYFRRHSN